MPETSKLRLLDLFSHKIGGFRRCVGVGRVLKQWPLSKSIPIASAYSRNIGRTSPATETSEPLLPLDLPQTASRLTARNGA